MSRCEHNVLRNGYWTGRRCSRAAAVAVPITAFSGTPDITVQAHRRGTEVYLCTQHASRFPEHYDRRPLDEETT